MTEPLTKGQGTGALSGSVPYLGLRVAVTAVAALVLLAHIVWGFRLDPVSAGLVLLAVLPWLAPLIKSVEIPGIGRVELQELRERTDQAVGAATSASQQAQVALASTAQAPPGRSASSDQNSSAAAELAQAAAEYNRVREELPSGSARTTRMTAIVSRMIQIAKMLPAFDVDHALRSENRGERLAGYAYLYARPDPRHWPELVTAVTKREDKPFGQYWGIQAMQQMAAQGGADTVSSSRASLQVFLDSLQPGTDRYFELSRLLATMKAPQ